MVRLGLACVWCRSRDGKHVLRCTCSHTAIESPRPRDWLKPSLYGCAHEPIVVLSYVSRARFRVVTVALLLQILGHSLPMVARAAFHSHADVMLVHSLHSVVQQSMACLLCCRSGRTHLQTPLHLPFSYKCLCQSNH
jgi:hypothetical protein